jgi:hypothetical protein
MRSMGVSLWRTSLSRVTDRIQLTSDGWQVYRDAVARAFGTEIDYAMLVKEYTAPREGHPVTAHLSVSVLMRGMKSAHRMPTY